MQSIRLKCRARLKCHASKGAFVLISATLAVCRWTSAQAACEDDLIRATYQQNSSVSTDWRLATLVTQSVWDEVSHNGGANAQIYGVPVGASYADYQRRAQNMLQSSSQSYSNTQLLNIAWTGLDRNSITAYEACLQTEAAKAPGLHLGVRTADDGDVLLLASWTLPGGGPIKVTWTPSIVEGYPIPTQVPSGSVTVQYLGRRPMSPLRPILEDLPPRS